MRILAKPVLALFGFLSACGLGAQSLSRYEKTKEPEATIEIRAGERSTFRIPRTVYGTFMEHIGNEVFGGILAQILDNPSLEDYPANLRTLFAGFSGEAFLRSTEMGLPLPWLPLRKSGWRYEPRRGGAANSDAYLYLMGVPTTQKNIDPADYVRQNWLWISVPQQAETGIRQTVYLPVERVLEYRGTLYASSAEGPVRLNASIRRKDDPDSVLATAAIEVPGGGNWTKLAFNLSLPAGAVKPLDPVDFAISLLDSHRVSLDLIRLYPADAVEGVFDPDIISLARGMKTALLREGGNFTSGYHWRDGVGPLDGRRTTRNQPWGIPEFNEFGTDEFMAFCRLIGAEPHICLNLGSGTVEEARAWAEYCLGGPGTPEGARRAANGHAAPYSVAAWEMGNEIWGDFQIGWQTPEGNVRRYLAYRRAISDLAPNGTLMIANGADVDFYRDWNGALIKDAGPELSYMSTHFVAGTDSLKNKEADQETKMAAGLAIPVGMAHALEALRGQIEADPVTRGRVKLAFTEWTFGADDPSLPDWSNLGGAIIGAGWMNMILSHADLVPVSNMTGLAGNQGARRSRGRVFVSPQYWTFWLYANRAGDIVLGTRTRVRHYAVPNGNKRLPESPGVPYLDVLATRDSKTGEVILFVVNRDWKNAVPALLKVGGFSPAPEARVESLAGASIASANDDEHPDAVRPMTSMVRVSGGRIRYEFPKHSLTVITLKPKR